MTCFSSIRVAATAAAERQQVHCLDCHAPGYPNQGTAPAAADGRPDGAEARHGCTDRTVGAALRRDKVVPILSRGVKPLLQPKACNPRGRGRTHLLDTTCAPQRRYEPCISVQQDHHGPPLLRRTLPDSALNRIAIGRGSPGPDTTRAGGGPPPASLLKSVLASTSPDLT